MLLDQLTILSTFNSEWFTENCYGLPIGLPVSDLKNAGIHYVKGLKTQILFKWEE